MNPTNPNTNTSPTPDPANPTPAAAAPAQPALDSAQPNEAKKPSAVKIGKTSVFKHWYTWVIVVLSFCSVVCIIFAAFCLSNDASQQSRINDLAKKLEEQEALAAKYAAQLAQKVEDSSHAGYIDGNKVTTKDFIYVGEWGIRFYIPQNLTDITYSYQTNIIEGIDGSPIAETEMICVTGVPRSATRIPEYYRLGVEEAPLGCITKQPDNNLGTDSTAKSVYQDGTSYFIYHAPQGTKSVREEDRAWEEEATKLVQDLLSRNITKF